MSMAAPRASVAALSRRRAAALASRWASSTFSSSSPAAPAASVAAAACLLCQWRAFSASSRARRDAKPLPPKPAAAAPSSSPSSIPIPPAEDSPAAEAPPPSPLASAPRSYGKRAAEFTPTPLSRPIGMPVPPVAGDNSGVDARSLQQKRDDLVNYEKHLVRREALKTKIAKPYFRDWTNLQFHKGKTFIAPPRLFRGDLSLYFPNLVGQRLLAADKAVAGHGLSDTTPLLTSRAASVVTVFSSLWAENQVRSFVSPEANPALAAVLDDAHRGDGQAQLVQVNVEDNAMRAWLVRRFRGSLRARTNPRDREGYFLVTRGITDDIRENIGLLNSKVGYVYLVDRHGRIRWAGSGPSDPDERQSLVKGVQRLLAEAKAVKP